MRYLVLCGGGSRGAIEVGFLQVLWEHGVRFDGILGSSVGALNGVFVAAGGHPDDLAVIWRRLRFRDCFQFNWRVLVRGTREQSLFTLGRELRSLIHRLGVRRFDELALPFGVMATDLTTGRAVLINHEPLEPALRASIAIPGLLPPVRIDERWLVDGSLAADLPLSQAVELGATELWAMRCSCCASPQYRFDSLPDILAQTFGHAVDRTRPRVEAIARGVITHIWSADGGRHVPSLNFSMADELISSAYRETNRQLGLLGSAEAAVV